MTEMNTIIAMDQYYALNYDPYPYILYQPSAHNAKQCMCMFFMCWCGAEKTFRIWNPIFCLILVNN